MSAEKIAALAQRVISSGNTEYVRGLVARRQQRLFDGGGYVPVNFELGNLSVPSNTTMLMTAPAVETTSLSSQNTPPKYDTDNYNATAGAPSFREFYSKRQQEIRDNAVVNMLNTLHPIVPNVPSRVARYASRLIGMDKAKQLFGNAKSPHTCIATTTSQYGDKEVHVPGNITFDENRTGFVEVDENDYRPGDLLNIYRDYGRPKHSTMITGIAGNGNPLLSYSNGGIDSPGEPTKMRYDKDNLYLSTTGNPVGFGVSPDNRGKDTYKVFRYVGSPTKFLDWADEYGQRYGTEFNADRKAISTSDAEANILLRFGRNRQVF